MAKNNSEDSEKENDLRDRLTQITLEYDLVINEIQVAIALFEIVYDQGEPVDYRIANLNRKYQETTGLSLSEVRGRSLKELFPESEVFWEKQFVLAVKTGEPQRFDRYSERFGIWIDVTVKFPRQQFLLVTFSDITKRKKAEIALEESRNILNEMGRMARVGGWEMDVETHKAKWTECMFELFRLNKDSDPPELNAQFSLYPPGYSEIIKKTYEKSVADLRPFSIESKYLTSTGEERWARIYGEPIEENGSVKKLKGFLQDITAMKEIELELINSQKDLKEKNEEYLAVNEEYMALNEELTESNEKILALNEQLLEEKATAERNEALYKTIFNTTRQGVFIYGSKDKLEYINPAGCKMHGMTEEQLLQKNPQEFIHPDTYSIFLEFIRAVDEDREYNGEASGITSTGGTFDVVVYGCPIYIDGKKKYYSTITDVTQQKKQKKEIEEKNDFIQRILDLSMSQIYIYDVQNFERLYINKAADDFLQGSAEEARKYGINTMEYVMHPDDRQKVFDHLRKVTKAADEDILEIEYRMKDKTGKYHWFFSKNTVFRRDSEGNTRQIISTATDITELKKIEQQLEEQNKEILVQNEEYLALNEELEESNIKLIKANEELDSFVYRVSHDLRAPIASSMGLANLTLKESSLEYIKKYSQLQIESLKRLDDFIKDILNYSRNSRLNLNIETVEMKELVDEVMKMLKDYELGKRKIKFYEDIEMGVMLNSDRMRLKIILNNLLSNAFKYYDDEKEKPFVRLSIQRLSGQFIKISVSDNGIGIRDEHIESVYEMFYRATVQRTGSGLGLYIVRDCLNKINGSIELISKEGEGTEFILTIPDIT